MKKYYFLWLFISSITTQTLTFANNTASDRVLINLPLPAELLDNTLAVALADTGRPLTFLTVGDIFNAADYTVYVTEVVNSSPTNGLFSGKGYVNFAYPMGIAQDTKVTFDNISLNDCYEMTHGRIVLFVNPNKRLTDIDGIVEGLEIEYLKLRITKALDRLAIYEGSQSDLNEFTTIYTEIEKVKAKIQQSALFPDDMKQFYIQEIDKALSSITCILSPNASGVPNGRIDATAGGCSIKVIETVLSEVSKALVNPWGYVISKGGACLKGFMLDLAGQYVVSYGLRSIMGEPTDFYTIYREDITMMSAVAACGNSVLESIRGKCDVCDAVVSVVVTMADDVKTQYQSGTPLEQINYVKALQSGSFAALAEVVGKYVVAPLAKAVGKYGAVLARKAFQDKLSVPKPVCDIIFSGNLCFAAGTPIRMADGSSKAIENITTNDCVWSREQYTNHESAQEVHKPFTSTAHSLIKITTGIDTILATPNHPFYVENKGMIAAQYLQKGDKLSTATPTEVTASMNIVDNGLEIEATEAIDTTVTVYNFEVADYHTYFVGHQSIWVHNANCGPKALIAKGTKGWGELDMVKYSQVSQQVGDNLSGHHIPSQKFMSELQKNILSGARKDLTAAQKIALENWKPEQVFTIMVEETQGELASSRHYRTNSWGRKKIDFTATPKEAFEADIQNLIKIFEEDGLYTPANATKIGRFKQKMIMDFKPLFD